MAKRESRYRDFATIIYPDCNQTNWLQILKETHLPVFISPLHDKDVNANGTPKKPHYHVMIMFEAPRTLDNIKEFVASFEGVGVEIIKTKRGYSRYLCHMDNPEKAQYSSDDVRSLGGANYHECCMNGADKFMIIDEIIDFIAEEKVEDILELYAFARICPNSHDWRRTIQENIYLFDKFCSANYKKRVYGKDFNGVQKVQIVNIEPFIMDGKICGYIQ